MDQGAIEEIRSATFELVRKGYDPDEVRRYLGELADRLEREDSGHPASEAVRRELERIGEKTANLLAEAEESAERMHAEAVREASAVLSKAREDADATRRAADEHASEVRATADKYAEEMRAKADVEQRAQIESEVGDLNRRRDEILAELAKLAGELQRTVGERSGGNGDTPAAETVASGSEASETAPASQQAPPTGDVTAAVAPEAAAPQFPGAQ